MTEAAAQGQRVGFRLELRGSTDRTQQQYGAVVNGELHLIDVDANSSLLDAHKRGRVAECRKNKC